MFAISACVYQIVIAKIQRKRYRLVAKLLVESITKSIAELRQVSRLAMDIVVSDHR